METTDHQFYIAKHEGLHLSMISLAGHRIFIRENKYLKVGDRLYHPPGYTILLVVSRPEDISTYVK